MGVVHVKMPFILCLRSENKSELFKKKKRTHNTGNSGRKKRDKMSNDYIWTSIGK